ncbi:aldo/keto reductase [Arthrobacter yangruifuii]|uniref:Aldo/keto reductase n=1 Tax=Arthrobacter yangruifuii TaxID=2606616 RepID=A0A5N6MQB3_9MICC|nr:aldo/keto reductase [Arthrobacter yangruifuii]KAD3720662.1 aldo/keto reductase [Arthrobacter yangruifuii]
MQPAPRVPLNNGVLIDQIGFGTYKIAADDAARLCLDALEAGYRHIDTAALYGNEAGVGEAVEAFTGRGRAERSDLFVTSKVWNTDQGYDSTLRAFDASLARLGLDYLDLYLIHWPCPQRGQFIDTYRALEQLYADGRVRAVGVSNFQPSHLEQLLDATGIVPAVNQIELHPWLAQEELRQLHRQLGIRTAAWSPLGRGAVLADPTVVRIAADLGRTPAQVILRWHLDLGNIVIPKASSPERIAGNLDLLSFELAEEHRTALNGLDRGYRSGSHPDEVN